MPSRLSTTCRATLLRAGKDVKGMIRVNPQTGNTLQARGLGHYHHKPDSMFYLNWRGLKLIIALEKGSTWIDLEKEYL